MLLQKHNLLQNISRVNRKFEGKEKGLVVDYIGIKSRMHMALAMYSMSDEVNFEDIRQSLTEVRNHLDLLCTLFHTLITSLASLPGGELQEIPGQLSP